MDKNRELLGATAAALGAYLSVHGERFTPKELVTLTLKQSKGMARDVKAFHINEGLPLSGMIEEDVEDALAPVVEVEAFMEDDERDQLEPAHVQPKQKDLARALKEHTKPFKRFIELASESDQDSAMEDEGVAMTPLEKQCCDAQGANDPIMLVKLAFALYFGTWISDKEARKIGFGGEVRSCETARAHTKMKLPSLNGCKDFAAMNEHFTAVAQTCADNDQNGLSQLVHGAWSESVSTFGADFKPLFDYWEHYLCRKYKGQGLPEKFDNNLALRFKTTSSSESKKAAEDARVEMKEIRKEMLALSRENKKLAGEMGRMATRGRPGTADDKEADKKERLKSSKCYNCGKYGHLAMDCEEEDKRVKEEDA